MYKCHDCRKMIGPGIPATRVVVETRPKTYPYRHKANRNAALTEYREGRKGGREDRDDRGGKGWEVVEEVACCPACVNQRRAAKLAEALLLGEVSQNSQGTRW